MSEKCTHYWKCTDNKDGTTTQHCHLCDTTVVITPRLLKMPHVKDAGIFDFPLNTNSQHKLVGKKL